LFYLQKTGDVTNTGTSTLEIGTVLVTLLDLSIHLLHTSDTVTADAAGYLQELFDNLSNINTDNHIASFELVKHYLLQFIL
jgi:hypothetical protein